MATLHLNKVFNSFEEFEQAQEKYENENFMVWVRGRSTSVEHANALLRSKGRTDLFDEKLKYRYVNFSCKLGVLPNQEKRIGTGKGDRPRQESHKIGCPAFLYLSAKGRNQLFIKEFVPEHNHECDERVFNQLPEKRDLTSDAQEKVKLLFEGGVKPSVVRNILRGLTGSVTARDLANYRARWNKEKHGGLSEEERLATVLQNLKEADDGASIFIGTDDEENLKYVFFQTSGMRKNVAQYGRVILLDHSHKVNKNRMPVCVLMVMDGEGNGRAAGYAFVANEQLVTVADVLSSFRQSIGEDVAMGVKTIVIDKDPSEIGAIQEVFPDVHIQLCIFHVGRTLKEKSSKETTEVKEIVDELKYVRTDARFKALCSQLEKAASVDFYEYMKENWLDCPQAWSFRDKQHSINLGNTTTNRVENHNSKIKMILNSKSTLADAVEGLLNIFTNKEEDVYFRETTASFKVAYLTTAISDPIVNAMLNDLTRFASDLLINELQKVPSDEEIVEYEGSTSECGCPHFMSYDLPCRHIFQCRRMQGEKPYHLGEIAPMFRKKRLCDVAIAPGLVKKKILPVTVPKTSREKYNAANDTCRLISSLLAECGSAQFHERSLVLKELFKLWAEGKEVVLLEKPKVLDMPCKDTSVNPGENTQPKVTSQAQHTAQETEMEHIKISDSTPDENAKQNETPQAQHTSQETEENGIPVIVLDSDDELCDTEVRDVYIKVEEDDFDTPKTPATPSTDIGLEFSDFILTHDGASEDGGANRLSELVLAMDNDNESSGSNTKEKEVPLHSDTATPRKHFEHILNTS
ncbi:uncharacterized protein LOC127750611 isoform X2 [Frankliniella occidentalis]|uniref:Uncharacterized protein LOC127750611 isoform X2 n=1 Tax=Frankliniella occidentalis TaxID=133901 RepID=A0A9C6XRM6_FRAOC|nr:uncharacterized protein LOC127750611 isoform X2 [Frankliniella occidentalis]